MERDTQGRNRGSDSEADDSTRGRHPDHLARRDSAGGAASAAGRRFGRPPTEPLTAFSRPDWESYIAIRLANRHSPQELVAEMRAAGSTSQDSDALMREIVHGYYIRAYREVLLGVAGIVAGVGLSLATYTMASSKGGTYAIFWGLAIVGLASLGKGVAGWRSAPRY
jgi:hypothetical protein